MAAIRGDVKQVKELISLGADVNVKDFAGMVSQVLSTCLCDVVKGAKLPTLLLSVPTRVDPPPRSL